MSNKELKPCPFCGGAAHIKRQGTHRVSMVIMCGECGALLETGETGWIDERSQWNARADTPAAEPTQPNPQYFARAHYYHGTAGSHKWHQTLITEQLTPAEPSPDPGTVLGNYTDKMAKKWDVDKTEIQVVSFNRVN